jgi:hypothetical protein
MENFVLTKLDIFILAIFATSVTGPQRHLQEKEYKHRFFSVDTGQVIKGIDKRIMEMASTRT